MACADTTVLLDLAGRGGRALKARATSRLVESARQGQRLTTTRLNLAEVYVGLSKSGSPRREGRKLARVLRFFEVFEFDDRAARRFGEITAYLHRIGRPVGDMDALIAATVLANGDCLITRDARHFRDIPGLVVEDY